MLVAFVVYFFAANAQDTQMCPCLMDNDDALNSLVEQRNNFTEFRSTGPITATAALAGVGLEAYKALPNASYVLKVTSGGEIRYASISSCQMALEKTYDLLLQSVEEVRIISEYPTVHGSCRNRTYTPKDIQDVKDRRDGNFGGRLQ